LRLNNPAHPLPFPSVPLSVRHPLFNNERVTDSYILDFRFWISDFGSTHFGFGISDSGFKKYKSGSGFWVLSSKVKGAERIVFSDALIHIMSRTSTSREIRNQKSVICNRKALNSKP
jgi:hypothetical protein